ncbi:hypothetical protein ASPZODRAFT_87380 [Penicilliopsis zonata CBS 506.65]|uniref:Major facilitator superfamily (MFS) profile domain-containing protein n=1 Tax=Penicilliopsis zonata CBS 506.65 TaxID=1073090 RepID=A0A1L9SVP4_9EURO|nr:hypothetical protein ASPZODRAFT_87380 [Penicilliopsis zonata CBS 506.65]OJJ51246.1 hypothetical protein ASPZODRAFT_87380 [Penicilliopsis zonata CBS 506.65]
MPPYPAGIKLFSIGIGLVLAVICSNLDRSILSVAIPKITSEFNSLDDMAWYGSAYLLTSCCSQLMFGKLYAAYKIQWIFLGALGVFELGSILCAAAPNSNCLIIGRAIAGLGATGISTGALLIISHSMPVHQRPKYTAMIGACVGITIVIAPFLGGIFTDKLSWRWCFWINLPLGGLTFITIFFLVQLPNPPKKQTTGWRGLLDIIDIQGTALLLPSTVCLLLALQWGGTDYAWNSWRCILLFCVFGFCGLIWCYVQVREGDKATVPMRLLRMRSILAAMVFGFALFGVMFLQSYYMSIWFQAVKGVSAYRAGVYSLASTGAMTVAFPVTGILTSKTGYYVPGMIAGSILNIIASGLMTRYGVHTSTGYWIAGSILSGLGFGFGGQQCMMVPQTILEGEDIALGTAVIMFAETISGTIFLAVGESIFENKLVSELRDHAPTVDPSIVIANGASGLRAAMGEIYGVQVVEEILVSYADALQPIWIITVALGALSLVGAVCTEWVSVKKGKDSRVAVEMDAIKSEA